MQLRSFQYTQFLLIYTLYKAIMQWAAGFQRLPNADGVLLYGASDRGVKGLQPFAAF